MHLLKDKLANLKNKSKRAEIEGAETTVKNKGGRYAELLSWHWTNASCTAGPVVYCAYWTSVQHQTWDPCQRLAVQNGADRKKGVCEAETCMLGPLY